MSPSLWSGAAAVPGVLQLGRAQLWFGCILYFYCWTLTILALISKEWTCSLGVITNLSCPQCPSWEHEFGKDHYQTALLTVATVLGALGYISLALRWVPMFARFPVLKLLSVLLLGAVIVLDFEAHFSYQSTYDGSVASSATSDSLFFCTAYSYALIAAVYGCLTIALLAWHEWVEWSVRRKMRDRREERRRLRAQQQQSGSERPVVVVEQPGAAAAAAAGDKEVAAPPSQLETTSTSPLGPPSLPLPPPATAPSTTSSLSQPNGVARASSYPSSPSSPSGPASSFRASVAEWLERLGLYTRADTKLDSLLLKWSWKDQLSPMQRRLVLGINAFFLLLYFGGLIISSIEGWALQDGVNYILSSWCTLGYGLYTPITTGGRLFMYVFWPVGFIVISSTSTTIWRVILARADRVLKNTTEKLIAREPAARPASQRRSGHVEDNGREKEKQMSAAHVHDGGGESDEEDKSGGGRRHSPYPALKDIMFNSPSRRHSLSHHSMTHHTDNHMRAQSNDEHTTPASDRIEHVQESKWPVDTRRGSEEGTSCASPTAALHLSSHARPSTVRSSPRPAQRVEPQKYLTSPARRSSLPNEEDRSSLPNEEDRSLGPPTVRYPLTWGRGNLSLTVYEAAREQAAMPSLSDVFAPLHSAANSTAADGVTADPSQQPLPAPPLRPQPSRPTASPLPLLPRGPTISTTSATPSHRTANSRGTSSASLTMVNSSLRDDFLAHLRQQTSHEQLQRDIHQRRGSATPTQRESVPAAHRLSAVHEDEGASPASPASPQSSPSSKPMPLPPPNPQAAPTTLASAALRSSAPFAHPALRATPATDNTALLREIAPLLMKLGIAVLAVICWICLAGGVLVWSEGHVYGYWDCQWSAFNLLTTISVGSIATPFSTKTSAFFVWYLLLGVGTLAYCFALIAQLAFIAFDKREAQMHQHMRSVAHLRSAGGGSGELGVAAGRKKAALNEEEGFVAHAKELDSLILQLVQKQAAAIESEEDAEKQHQAFMRYPVAMFGGEGASGEQVEVPLEGVSLLLRYHLAFQAFERERTRMNNIRMARAARSARVRSSRQILQQSPSKDTQVGGDAVKDGEEAGTAQQQNAEGGAGNGAEQQADGEEQNDDSGEDEDEEKLAGNGPTDRWFDWSNDTDWIAQAEQESASLPADAHEDRKPK